MTLTRYTITRLPQGHFVRLFAFLYTNLPVRTRKSIPLTFRDESWSTGELSTDGPHGNAERGNLLSDGGFQNSIRTAEAS